MASSLHWITRSMIKYTGNTKKARAYARTPHIKTNVCPVWYSLPFWRSVGMRWTLNAYFECVLECWMLAGESISFELWLSITWLKIHFLPHSPTQASNSNLCFCFAIASIRICIYKVLFAHNWISKFECERTISKWRYVVSANSSTYIMYFASCCYRSRLRRRTNEIFHRKKSLACSCSDGAINPNGIPFCWNMHSTNLECRTEAHVAWWTSMAKRVKNVNKLQSGETVEVMMFFGWA